MLSDPIVILSDPIVILSDPIVILSEAKDRAVLQWAFVIAWF